MKRPKIVADSAIPFLEGVLEPYADVVYEKGSDISRDDVLDADALIIRTRTKCNAALLDGTAVKFIATATIGTDHIDLDYCRKNGIEVHNSAGCNAGGVMNYVFSALYGISARKSISLDNKVFGIIGVGHVGKRVETAAKTLGFQVLRCDPPRAKAEGKAGFVSQEELLERSDIVTLHVPLSDQTRGMAGQAFFGAMKDGSIFINASRGEVVDEKALKANFHKFDAVIIDTWNNEPDIDPELLDMVDVATPHIAGYSFQGKQNGTSMAVRALARFFGFGDLYDYFPETPEEMTKVDIDVTGMAQGACAARFQYNYPIFSDDFMLKTEPEGFENLRNHYNYRKEFDIKSIRTMMTQSDIDQITGRGITLEDVESQVKRFRKGFPMMKIVAPATPHRGISVLGEAEIAEAEKYNREAKVAGRCKFVPASGAASRMFKDIFSDLDKVCSGTDVAADSALGRLAASIEKFAFYSEDVFGKPEDSAEYRKKAGEALLKEPGLGYGSKPKGVIKFHRYPDGEVRTAFAEHLVEANAYMKNPDGSAKLIVTISPEHRELFEAALAEVKEKYEKKYGVRYDIKFTYQDTATDTIAVDMNNNPFRTDDGRLLFRPAGHGALIINLNNVDEELVSIKNIDNVSNEKYLPITARYKNVLAGEALKLRDKIFGYLRALDAEADVNSDSCKLLCDKIEAFLDKELCTQLPLVNSNAARVTLIRGKLDRPIRVCGMVRNQGEPGGGPFIIAGKDGTTSLQILEGVQINKDDAGAMDALAHATHFNPVDLVCCIKNYKGEKFNLLKYIDEEAGFMSCKSYQGRELKALERPGLWNGAMSEWNTKFIEVPLETFNPVKVVLDLLRSAHQN
ncbi:MAG: DUF4301 family protein [Bacteroidales bacterium]|nr:DUF4301 family protein [Bacteroidales bacterium]